MFTFKMGEQLYPCPQTSLSSCSPHPGSITQSRSWGLVAISSSLAGTPTVGVLNDGRNEMHLVYSIFIYSSPSSFLSAPPLFQLTNLYAGSEKSTYSDKNNKDSTTYLYSPSQSPVSLRPSHSATFRHKRRCVSGTSMSILHSRQEPL